MVAAGLIYRVHVIRLRQNELISLPLFIECGKFGIGNLVAGGDDKVYIEVCGVVERLCPVCLRVLPPVCGRIAEMLLVDMDIGEGIKRVKCVFGGIPQTFIGGNVKTAAAAATDG